VESSRPRPKVRVEYVPASSYEDASYRRGRGEAAFDAPRERAGYSRADRKGPQYDFPAGYNLRDWDREERPIVVAGSVFDANSLGKWIFDWSCTVYGKGSPIADVAGELWLGLIRLAGRIGELGVLPKSQVAAGLLRRAERLWYRFVELVQVCNDHMLSSKEAVRDGRIGQKSVSRFLGVMFGRGQNLEATERLIQSIRNWNFEYQEVYEPMR
jgi:hypothetical protein